MSACAFPRVYLRKQQASQATVVTTVVASWQVYAICTAQYLASATMSAHRALLCFNPCLPHPIFPGKPPATVLSKACLCVMACSDMITKRHIDMHPDVPGEAQHTFFRSKPLFAEFAAVGMKLDQLNFLQVSPSPALKALSWRCRLLYMKTMLNQHQYSFTASYVGSVL